MEGEGEVGVEFSLTNSVKAEEDIMLRGEWW
jgi:hypothetical protein